MFHNVFLLFCCFYFRTRILHKFRDFLCEWQAYILHKVALVDSTAILYIKQVFLSTPFFNSKELIYECSLSPYIANGERIQLKTRLHSILNQNILMWIKRCYRGVGSTKNSFNKKSTAFKISSIRTFYGIKHCLIMLLMKANTPGKIVQRKFLKDICYIF